MKKIISLIILCQGISFAQTSYYVGTSGTDGVGFGLSTTTPFKTVTYASTQVSPGDTVFVMAGTYTNANYGNGNMWNMDEAVKINNLNGTPSSYITIKPYNNQTVKFRGDGDYIVKIRNSSYLDISGFELEGEVNNIPLDSAKKYQFLYKDAGNTLHYRVPPGTPNSTIQTMTFTPVSNITRPSLYNTIGFLVQNSNHINVGRCHVHHTPGTGLRAFACDYINFYLNEVNDCSRKSSVGNHGIVVEQAASIDANSGNKINVAQNNVYHNYNEIFSWSENKTFIDTIINEGKGIALEKNSVSNGWAHGNILVENNICYTNGLSGIHINNGVRTSIRNNTCYMNSTTGNGNNLGISIGGGDSIEIVNNIVVADTTWGGFAISSTDTAHIEISNNLVKGYIDAETNIIDVNTIFANPNFVNASSGDFHLLSNSLAINSSLISTAPAIDYYSLVRDAQPDIGAVEYFGSTGLPLISSANSLEVYPNPVNDILIVKSNGTTNPIVTSIEGKKIDLCIDKTGGKYLLNVTPLPNGIYFIRINNELVKVIKMTK